MKKITSYILLLTCFIATCSRLHAQTKENTATVKLDKVVNDFGTINESIGNAIAIFTVENTGDKPFIINKVETFCGCTQAEYSHEPILPNEKSEIKIGYGAKNRVGSFEKSVRLYTNGTPSMVELTIKGVVEKENTTTR